MPKTPEDIIRDEIRALKAYHVPDSAGMVKLDAMENPYRLPPELRAPARATRGGSAALNRYPGSGRGRAQGAAARALDVPAGMELAARQRLRRADPDAGARGREAGRGRAGRGAVLRDVPHDRDLRRRALRRRGAARGFLARHRAHAGARSSSTGRRVVFIAYPNNPTGNLFDAGLIERIIEAAPGLVVVDEAYHAFAGAELHAAPCRAIPTCSSCARCPSSDWPASGSAR